MTDESRTIIAEGDRTWVWITDRKTGVTRAYYDPYLAANIEEEIEKDSFYIWEAGNYSCDCNRSLFFARAVGTPEQEIDESPCGHGRFSVRIRHDGEIVYEED